MTDTAADARTVTVERAFAHAPAKLWRALTQPHLVAAWLMPGDVSAQVGHRFEFGAEWGKVACEVLEVDPERVLAWRWNGPGLESVVTWTLTPSGTGTVLRMEQTGFRADQDQAYFGARAGWPRFLSALDSVLGRLA